MGLLGVQVAAAPSELGHEILSDEAVTFIAHLVRRFRPGLEQLLHKRAVQQSRFDSGEKPCFLPETRHIREGDWKVCPLFIPAVSSVGF